MEIARGDLVVAIFAGDYGRPRPALVAQSDVFLGLESITLLPLTTDLRDWPLFRILVDPTRENGLQQQSHVMIDKPATISRAKVGRRIGSADAETMQRVELALKRFLGLD